MVRSMQAEGAHAKDVKLIQTMLNHRKHHNVVRVITKASREFAELVQGEHPDLGFAMERGYPHRVPEKRPHALNETYGLFPPIKGALEKAFES